jgi:hypothetical protein
LNYKKFDKKFEGGAIVNLNKLFDEDKTDEG